MRGIGVAGADISQARSSIREETKIIEHSRYDRFRIAQVCFFEHPCEVIGCFDNGDSRGYRFQSWHT
jgi:hypothetical protein